MENTILQQGKFTSDGKTKTLKLRSDVDWIKVYNTTVGITVPTTAVGVKYYWQRGFLDNAKWVTFKSNAANALNLEQYVVTNGFSLVDSSVNPVGTLNSTITAISNAAIPVLTTSAAHNLIAGDVVRLINVTGAQQVGGFDFTVGNNTLTGTTASLDYMSQVVAGTNGSFRKIKFDPLYYPANRTMTSVATGATTTVVFSVTHGYKVGQTIRFVVPASFGMTELDGLLGTITAVNTSVTVNSITVDIDSTAFTAFAWPLTAAVPFSSAEAIPVGIDTAQALSSGVDGLSDATENTGFIGMRLAGGASNPAGVNGNEIFWVAGKSFNVDNQ